MPYSGRKGVTYKEVRVPKPPLLACLTCPLCSYLFREATTISECLHSFCKDCITAELSNGETECCPMCHVSLGPLPLEKLRTDHQLNDLKEKLFPSNVKKRKLGLVIGSPGSSTSTRRKERSLYSLGVKGTPAVNPGYASRKTRAIPGTHVSSEPSSIDEELEDEDEEEPFQDDPTIIPKSESRTVSHNGAAEPQIRGSRKSSPDRPHDGKVYPQSEPRRRMEDLAATPTGDRERTSHSKPWTMSKLSHRLAQCSKSTKSSKAAGSLSGHRDGMKNVRGSRKNNASSSHGLAGRTPEFSSALDALAQAANADAAREDTMTLSGPPSPCFPVPNTPATASEAFPGQRDTREAGSTKVASNHKDGSPAASNGQSLQVRLRQTLNGVLERPSILRNTRPFPGAIANPPSRTPPNGIWFHLEAGDNQTNEDALPPLASPYVRIKDGKLPVYHVKTYLVQKLAHKVKTEMEVEITCRGQPVVSSLPLESIRDIWFSAQSVPDQPQPQPQGETSTASANGSGPSEPPSPKDFLMVLTYKRHRKPRIC